MPQQAVIVGPSGGALDNAGERLKLARPDQWPDPDPDIAEQVEYIQVDRVRYNDKAPWPTPPSGNGPSLERVAAAGYGNDPANWAASESVGGTPGAANSVASVPGDLDGDGDVDLVDFGRFQACFRGPGQPAPMPACASADFDGDDCVDLLDFRQFLLHFTGPR